MIYSKIIGHGSYLPTKILTNKDLESTLDTTDEWIFSRTGIIERHIADDNETTSDLAYMAAMEAIKFAEINANDIDLIILATTTPDKIFPSTACTVQAKLGIKCPAFDIQAVCTGFIYALSIADKFIKTSSAKNILVIGADIMSSITDYKDISNAIVATSSPTIASQLFQTGLAKIMKLSKLDRYGLDCYAYAMLADGSIDAVIEFGLQEYDIRAPEAIVLAAGGIISNLDGSYPLTGGNVIASGDSRVHDKILEVFNN